MGYAVGHLTKMGSGAGGIGSHIDREQKKPPKNVDPDRTHLNKEYVATGGTLVHDINERIKEGYKSVNADGTPREIRKDAVKAVGFILSGSNKDMLKLQSEGKLDEWAQANLKFCSDRYGKENIVRFTMHMDEKTPHIHCVFVPLDAAGNLTAKSIVGNKAQLSQLQTDYADAMKPFGLERGMKNTRLKHTTTRQYYAEVEHHQEEATIDTNLIGQPKDGEQERIQQLVANQQMEIIRMHSEMLREQARYEEEKKKLEEEKKKLSEAKEAAVKERIKFENERAHITVKSAQLDKYINDRSFKDQVDLMHRVNVKLFESGSKLQIANMDKLQDKDNFAGFKLELKEDPRGLEIHKNNNNKMGM